MALYWANSVDYEQDTDEYTICDHAFPHDMALQICPTFPHPTVGNHNVTLYCEFQIKDTMPIVALSSFLFQKIRKKDDHDMQGSAYPIPVAFQDLEISNAAASSLGPTVGI